MFVLPRRSVLPIQVPLRGRTGELSFLEQSPGGDYSQALAGVTFLPMHRRVRRARPLQGAIPFLPRGTAGEA